MELLSCNQTCKTSRCVYIFNKYFTSINQVPNSSPFYGKVGESGNNVILSIFSNNIYSQKIYQLNQILETLLRYHFIEFFSRIPRKIISLNSSGQNINFQITSLPQKSNLFHVRI